MSKPECAFSQFQTQTQVEQKLVREDGFNRTFPMTDRRSPIPGLN
ncbi:hypothetical protein [Roseofilum capinflatum]|uniref:Uncharacterized protein n=1 Tax=Roseofilum capinflatum BLCC-M114 TaxID=3022440 RepID=A0ABT7B6S8_9CYAN|nr:hypothetical protein [Roseofilum capinflatum]MDJ1174334.1 hypothetical protein [Roseofilum capinflatum BLCC-M114]